MAINRRHTPELDGGVVSLGAARERRLTIEASGAPTPPFWVRLQPSGVVMPVASLPWRYQGVAESVEYLSEEPDEQPPLIFASDHGAAQGTGATAVGDGGKWVISGTVGSNGLSVVDGSLAGFPMANCLRVGVGDFPRIHRVGLGVPTAGQTRYYRWYYRNELPAGFDQSSHPIESGQVNGLDWSFNVQIHSDTEWHPEFRPAGGDNIQSVASYARWTPLSPLPISTPYRIEMAIHMLGNNQFNLHGRIYDMNNVLLLSDADFRDWGVVGSGTGTTSLASIPTFIFPNNSNGARMDEIRMGANDPHVRLYAYQGGMAISDAGWIGPYRPGEAA